MSLERILEVLVLVDIFSVMVIKVVFCFQLKRMASPKGKAHALTQTLTNVQMQINYHKQ